MIRHGGAVTDSSVTSIAARLMSAQGIGAIAGSLLVANLVRRFRRSTLVTVLMTLLAVLAPLPQYAPSWVTTALLMFVMGSCVAIVQSVFGGVVQRDASPAHRGRGTDLAVPEPIVVAALR